MHNITAEEVEANVVQQPDSPSSLETIAPGASTTFTLTTDETCGSPAAVPTDDPGARISRSYNVFVKTVTGDHITTIMEFLPDDPRLSALCHD